MTKVFLREPKLLTRLLLPLAVILVCACNSPQTRSVNPSYSKVEKPIVAPNLIQDLKFDFEQAKIGTLPPHWSQYFTGRGKHTDWQVIDDQGNKVLAQLSQDHPNYHFNDVVFDGAQTKNASLKVRMKGVKGKKDQGGGFIWRWQDKNNYYVVRANPLEDNVVLYKVEKGKRTDLAVLGKGRTYGVTVPALGNDWNDLALVIKGDLFTVSLNGQEIFQVQDNTFQKAGKLGLWTKADAVSYFDDFQILMD